MQIDGCDDHNSTIFARVSLSCVPRKGGKIVGFPKGHHQEELGQRPKWASWASPVLPPCLLVDCYLLLPPGSVSEAAGGARHRKKLGPSPEWEVPSCLDMVPTQRSPETVPVSHPPSLIKEPKALLSIPPCLTLTCLLLVLHGESPSMELHIWRSLLWIFLTHPHKLMRLWAASETGCCDREVAPRSQWQDSRVSLTARWELRLNYNLSETSFPLLGRKIYLLFAVFEMFTFNIAEITIILKWTVKK